MKGVSFMAKRFKKVGAGIVTWEDACWMVRVKCLEDVEPLMQQSTGFIWLDRKQDGFIVVHNIDEYGTNMELTFIPNAWIHQVTLLEVGKKYILPELKALKGGAKCAE